MKWIDASKELPPCDGTYEITNFPEHEEDPIRREVTATAYYDGWGFKYLGVYRNPRFWCKFTERKEKRYGVVSDS